MLQTRDSHFVLMICLALLFACGRSDVMAPDSKLQEATEFEDVVFKNGDVIKAVKNEVLVYCNDDITEEQLNQLMRTIRSMDGRIIGSMQEMRIVQVSIPDTVSEEEFISNLKEHEGVFTAGLNKVLSEYTIITNDEGYNKKLSQEDSLQLLLPANPFFSTYPNIPLGESWWIGAIHADKAWDITTGANNNAAIIGIVDSGIPATQTVMDENRLQRFDATGHPLFDDDTGSVEYASALHGETVTGFAAAYQDAVDKKRCGMAWQNLVKVIDVFTPANTATCPPDNPKKDKIIVDGALLEGIKTAIREGSEIINISIGMTRNSNDQCSSKNGEGDFNEEESVYINRLQKFYYELTNAVSYAYRGNSLLVFAAGNHYAKHFENLLPYNDDPQTAYWSTNALLVAATDKDNYDTNYSHMGGAVDMAAPGDNIGFGHGLAGGTSVAAPLVTGTGALIKSVNPDLAAPEIRYILLNSAANKVRFSERGITGPQRLLDAQKAVETSELTVASQFEVLEPLRIGKGESRNIAVEITIPPTTVTALDILFLIDVSSSYYDDIDTLQSQAQAIVNNLSSRDIDVNFGVASFADFPMYPWGSYWDGDKAFFINQTITADVNEAVNGIYSLDNPMHYGSDEPESQLEALYQAALGSGIDINDDGDFSDFGEQEPQSVGWRPGAMKLILFSTDAPFHDSDIDEYYPGRGFVETIEALQNQGITVIGLQSGSYTDTADDISRLTNATNGEMFLLSADSSGIAESIVEGFNNAVAQIDLTLKPVAGEDWVTEITPELYEDVQPGETRTFTVTLTGQKNGVGFRDDTYPVYFWCIGNGSAVLKRIHVRMWPPHEFHY